jgi:putative ABC transport system permease protein
VTLAVAALTSVAFFADRLQGGLQRDALQILGGDAVVASDNPTPEAFVQRAQALGLQSVTTMGFPTMGRASDAQGGASRLVAFKSVQGGYPLRGSLTVAQAPGAPEQVTRDIPAPGEVWVDAPLLDALGLAMGDALLLGDAQLRIARVIVIEPDRGAGFMSFAPRVMVNAADVPATGLVQPASRLTYRFAVAGEPGPVRTFVEWAEKEVTQPGVHGVRLESLESGRPEMKQTLDRAQKFLSLVALLAALLSAVAVALAARGFAASHLDASAMLRVLGQSQRTIAWSYAIEFILVGLAASLLGVVLGYAVHYVFVLLLAGLVESSLPAASVWPAALGLGVGLTLLLAFGLPPVLQLAQVPPLRVIRRDMGALRPASLVVLGLGVAGFAALLLVVSSDIRLGLIAVGGFAAAAPKRERVLGAALAGAGHAADFGPPRLCGGAGQQPGRGPVGPGAAGAAAHRPDRQLAPGHPARCAQPLCHQHPARPGARLPANPAGRGCTPVRLVSHDPGPLGGRERPAHRARELHRRPCPAPGRAGIQPVERRRAAPAQRGGGRPLDAGRTGRRQRGRRPGQHPGPEARRHPAF